MIFCQMFQESFLCSKGVIGLSWTENSISSFTDVIKLSSGFVFLNRGSRNVQTSRRVARFGSLYISTFKIRTYRVLNFFNMRAITYYLLENVPS